VRQVAIQGLWEETSEDLVGPFVQLLLNDPSQSVRAAAAAALGPFVLAGELEEIDASQAMRAEEALLAVLHSDTELLEVQCRALESIAYSAELGVRQLIEDGYYSPYEEMHASALMAMGRSADTRWRGAVRAELDNPTAEVRAEAARACGELEARAALPELLELLGDEAKPVRLAAMFALGRIGGKDAEEALAAMTLSEDPDEVEAAELALEEVTFYGDPDAIPLLDEQEADWDWDEEPDDW
jgi:HEAT repeat protein